MLSADSSSLMLLSKLPPYCHQTNYSCNSCRISFQNGQHQRIHMKEPWQDRVASLPPIPLNAFEIQMDDKTYMNDSGTRKRRSSRNGRAETAAMKMASWGYLATEARTWHECLYYCGATKPSTLSIQSHMRDKGHCPLNLDREPELVDFWDSPQWTEVVGHDAALEQKRPTNLSATEIRFASGKVIGSRHAAPATKQTSKKRHVSMIALSQGSEDAESSPLTVGPQLASGSQLARREEMDILGVPVQQRQALVLADKKAQRSEAVARQAREWVYSKGANSQKFDQVDNHMQLGKQNHKLLPR
ncbi:hypothetical protein K504DRAFT_474113 [Pleomassaria siparia CBS 279.74]|uniref:ZN622/Rei1/Reh1 zinc finger C2H2-type domain-containing protein n=1 Tax=Pleomassaria siparia CBS 279.74 TaxID=1314801 RepID=A0A6G1JRZ0_9PLEO|nr:hypothetical protein K504DRAFT_474113 [Pleomassaria siparia CBS 279.74]